MSSYPKVVAWVENLFANHSNPEVPLIFIIFSTADVTIPTEDVFNLCASSHAPESSICQNLTLYKYSNNPTIADVRSSVISLS
jgi:hypothetical protein